MLKSENTNISKRRLKNYLINKEYQLKYVYWLLITSLFGIGLVFGVILYNMKGNYDFLITLGKTNGVLLSQLRVLFLSLVEKFIIVGFFYLLIIFILGIYLSHRTAGPMFRFKKVFDEIANGNANARIQYRPKDDFKDVADSFNRMMDQFQKNKQ